MNDRNLVIKDRILKAALPLVPFDGWTRQTLESAAVEAGYQAAMVRAVFPDGVKSALTHFSGLADRMMLERLDAIETDGMRVRDKIAHAVETRLDVLAPWKEAERLALAYWAVPFRKLEGAKILWRTADVIWMWAGDTATDYNRYTKRTLLSAVLASTMLAWMNDRSEGHAATRSFLARRIDNTLKLGGVFGKIVGRFKKA